MTLILLPRAAPSALHCVRALCLPLSSVACRRLSSVLQSDALTKNRTAQSLAGGGAGRRRRTSQSKARQAPASDRRSTEHRAKHKDRRLEGSKEQGGAQRAEDQISGRQSAGGTTMNFNFLPPGESKTPSSPARQQQQQQQQRQNQNVNVRWLWMKRD